MDNTEEGFNLDTFFPDNGCNPKYLGCYYSREILGIVVSNKLPILDFAYRTVAKKFSTCPANVERCVRSFIAVSWEQIGIFNRRPTSKEFFAECMVHIKRGKSQNIPLFDKEYG